MIVVVLLAGCSGGGTVCTVTPTASATITFTPTVFVPTETPVSPTATTIVFTSYSCSTNRDPVPTLNTNGNARLFCDPKCHFVGFNQISDAAAPWQVGRPIVGTSTPTPPTPPTALTTPSVPSGYSTLIPAGTRVSVLLRYIGTDYVLVNYNNQSLWIYSGSHTVSANNCGPIAMATPTFLPNYVIAPPDELLRQELLQYGIVLDNEGHVCDYIGRAKYC